MNLFHQHKEEVVGEHMCVALIVVSDPFFKITRLPNFNFPEHRRFWPTTASIQTESNWNSLGPETSLFWKDK